MKKTKLRKISIAVVVLSILVGGIGCIAGLIWTFSALERAENQGIGPVGDGLSVAVISLMVGSIGAVAGGGLLIYSTVKRDT